MIALLGSVGDRQGHASLGMRIGFVVPHERRDFTLKTMSSRSTCESTGKADWAIVIASYV